MHNVCADDDRGDEEVNGEKRNYTSKSFNGIMYSILIARVRIIIIIL